MAKEFNINDLVRKNIRDLTPYASARDEYSGSASVFLDANENPHNSPLNRYPDPKQVELKKKIAKLKDQESEHIFLETEAMKGLICYSGYCVSLAMIMSSWWILHMACTGYVHRSMMWPQKVYCCLMISAWIPKNCSGLWIHTPK